MDLSWENMKTPLAVVAVIVIVVLLIVVIIFLLKKNAKPLSPLELLVKNVSASALPIPARSVLLAGNDHAPAVQLAKRARVVYTTHLVIMLVRPTSARAGFFKSFTRKEIILVSPSDVEDFQGRTAIIRGTGITQYLHNLYWVHPDMQDATVRERWAKTLNLPRTIQPQELLSEVQRFFIDGVDSLLAVQEALVAMDINARSRRAIPLLDNPGVMSDYHVHHKPTGARNAGERTGQEDEEDLGTAPTQGGN